MKLRNFAFCFAIAVPGAALASYELMMYGTGQDGYVQRLDPVSGALLGRIGQGLLSYAGAVALEGNTGNILVADLGNARISRFNYSTGIYGGSFAVGFGPAALTVLADGTIVVGTNGGGTFRRYSPSGTVLNTITVSSTSYSVVQLANGSVLAIGQDKNIRRLNFTNNTAVVESFTMDGDFPFGAGAQGNLFGQINVNDSGRIQFIRSTAVGSYTNVRSFDLLANDPNNMIGRAVGFGHNGLAYALAMDQTADKTYLYTMDPLTANFATRREVPGTSEIGPQMAIVVAPEPASMLLVGLGLSALARRRRAK